MAAIDELAKLSTELQKIDTRRDSLIARRNDLARKAREEGITWRQIALTLDMTEHGIIKSVNRDR